MVIMQILNQMINSWVDITGNQIKRSINIVSFYLKSSNWFRRVNPAVSGINIQLGSGETKNWLKTQWLRRRQVWPLRLWPAYSFTWDYSTKKQCILWGQRSGHYYLTRLKMVRNLKLSNPDLPLYNFCGMTTLYYRVLCC